MASDIELIGLAAFERDMRDVGDNCYRPQLIKAMRPGARAIMKAVRQRVPRRQGYLYKALRVRTLRGKRDDPYASLAVTFKTNVYPWKNGKLVPPFYGIFVHNGTARYVRGVKRKHRAMSYEQRVELGGREGIKPRPFVADAFEAASKSAAEMILDKLQKMIER